jgi:hypothetical protein
VGIEEGGQATPAASKAAVEPTDDTDTSVLPRTTRDWVSNITVPVSSQITFLIVFGEEGGP